MDTSRDPSATGRRRRTSVALVAVVMVSGLLVATSQPTAADATRTVNTLCVGVDATTRDLLGVIGDGSLAAPITVQTTGPATLEPEQADVGVSVTYQINLPPDLVNSAIGFGISSLTIKNLVMDTNVSGPTATTSIPGRPADRAVTLVAGQAFSASFGPFSGTLTDIGPGGVVRLSTAAVTFSITLAVPGVFTGDLNLRCETNATVASIPIVIPGSPVITQPIEIDTTEGSTVNVDVLGQYVTNGVTREGEEKQVDPESLKVVEGGGTVVGGQLQIPAPPAGTEAEVVFEVCAGEVELTPATEGSSETQRIEVSVDPSQLFLRRPVGMRFALDPAQPGQAVWFAKHTLLSVLANPTGLPGQFITDPAPPVGTWDTPGVRDKYLFSEFAFPTVASVQAALESVPGIGPGNVVVTEVERTGRKAVWDVEFVNELANKDVDRIQSPEVYTILPREWLGGLLELAGGLGGDDGEGGEGGGEDEEIVIPDGLTPGQYADQLQAEANALLNTGQFEAGLEKFGMSIQVRLTDPEFITGLIAALNEAFQPPPQFSTPIPGEDPEPAQIQELCSQGVVVVRSAAVEGATDEQPAGVGGETAVAPSFAG